MERGESQVEPGGGSDFGPIRRNTRDGGTCGGPMTLRQIAERNRTET